MNPLHLNDRPAQMPRSWYVDDVDLPPLRPPLRGEVAADVVVLGAGFTGLWAALTLARAGRKVVVLEAHRAGWGASGRNGGQVASGFNKSQRWLESRLGDARAHALWDLAETGKAMLRDFVRDEAPEGAWKPGIAHGYHHDHEFAVAQAEAAHLAAAYACPITVLERPAFAALVKSPLYVGGTLDRNAGHVQPLACALALARAAEAAGATIFEQSEVTAIRPGARAVLTTGAGQVAADHAIIAGNGYLPGILPAVNHRVMPINSFIGATDPMPERWHEVLAEDIAVADSRFVVNYFRFSADRRMLFGGRENYRLRFPRDIAGPMMRRMVRLFPQLRGVPFRHVWGGSLAVTMSRLPHLVRIGPNVLSGAGFSGHGVALAGIAGRAMAEAVMGQEEGFATLAALPVPAFPGGAALRAPLLTLAMTWYSLRDRLGL